MLYSYTFTVLEKDLEEYLTGIVYTVTQRVDGDLHRTFTSRDQETSPEYLNQIAELGQVQKYSKTPNMFIPVFQRRSGLFRP